MIDSKIILPKFLYIEITSECNLRCKQCHMWMNEEDTKKSLSTSEKSDLIYQFYKINPHGTVILSGGETMLKESEFFTLSGLCRTLKLKSIANTNAVFINEGNYEKVLFEGPENLIISLDSHDPKIHDYVRGVKGSFDHTVKTIKGLVNFKNSHAAKINTKILTNSILFHENIDLWNDFIVFAKNELNSDGVMFQMLSRTFRNKAKKDHFFEKHFFKDVDATIKKIDSIYSQYKEDPFFMLNEADINWMKLYVKDPDIKETAIQVCDSHDKNIIIDEYGGLHLCFNMNEIVGPESIYNVRQVKLEEFWNSNNTEGIRALMRHCRKDCGMLSCHRNDSLRGI